MAEQVWAGAPQGKGLDPGRAFGTGSNRGPEEGRKRLVETKLFQNVHLIIHVGPPKTGTSFLQQSFTKFQWLLEARNILYPQSGRGGSEAHHELANICRSQPQADVSGFLAGVRRELTDKHRYVILSSELFADFRQKELSILAKIIQCFESVEFVFFVRRSNELVYSMWQELVKHGAICDFTSFLAGCLIAPSSKTFIDKRMQIDAYARQWGHANISLFNYSELMDSRVNIFAYFMDTMFKVQVPHLSHEIVNPSLDFLDIELIRILNLLFFTQTQLTSPLISFRYFELVEKGIIDRDHMRSDIGNAVTALDIPSNLPQFLHADTLLLNKYRDRIFPDPPVDRLFALNKSLTVKTVSYDRIPDDLLRRLRSWIDIIMKLE